MSASQPAAITRRHFATGAASIVLASPACLSVAQSAPFPARPVKVIFPFAAGGGPDSTLRLVCKQVELQNPGVSFIVENRPGAGGTIGTTAIKQAEPDGYTIMQGSHSTHATNPALYNNLSYDPIADFAPITLLWESRTYLIVPATVGVNSVQELADYAKRKGVITFASPGPGSGGHLGGVMLGRAFGVPATHVPYKGSGHARADVLAGRVDFMFNTVQQFIDDAAVGTVKVLALASSQRFDALPDIPTLAEVGFPNIEIQNWFGLFAPRNVPPAVLDKLNGYFVNAANTPEVREVVRVQGFIVRANSRAEFSIFVKDQAERLGRIVREQNITL